MSNTTERQTRAALPVLADDRHLRTCNRCAWWHGEAEYATWRQCSLDGEQTRPYTTCGAFMPRRGEQGKE